ncbi:plasmid pRiA4b ORF-3 family protein [Rhizobium leguminosarum]|nr:plasmid pRiA4b ORF-3 family protein [Rhizobium leguminosarum]NKK09140.1 plasmid pRiA4b ORF-3 family protein [Rhizobium leguminosarum bv. viciae]
MRCGDVDLLTEGAFEDEPRVFDYRSVRLRDFQLGSSFRYVYDFGDSWRHTIMVENFLLLDRTPKHGNCTGGERARPPEDIGGVGGYERFLAIMSDRSDPDYIATKFWCGGHFDPEWFDLATVNKDLRGALRNDTRRRLHQPKLKVSAKDP